MHMNMCIDTCASTSAAMFLDECVCARAHGICTHPRNRLGMPMHWPIHMSARIFYVQCLYACVCTHALCARLLTKGVSGLCVSLFGCVYVCARACMCMCVCACVRACVHVCLCVCVCMCPCTCVSASVCVYVFLHDIETCYRHVRRHVYADVCVHLHTCAPKYLLPAPHGAVEQRYCTTMDNYYVGHNYICHDYVGAINYM